MARLIEPIEVKWGNNVINIITSLTVQIVQDNLTDTCYLGYQLIDQNKQAYKGGTLSIIGDDYQNWDGNNDYPYYFAATALNVVLI